MKRVGNIYSKIIDKENIHQAILKASKGKKDKKIVKKVNDNIYVAVDNLYNLFKNENYIPSPYHKMKVQDSARKKVRTIYMPKFYPDQCIHWCLMLQIEPVLRRGMYDYCCASVKKRGIYYAFKYIKRILVQDRKNTKYCLQLDVKKFYPSIDKEILKRKFRKIIKCRETLNLMDLIVDSSTEGLPIGNYTSQWFANFYLQDLDHYIKEVLKVPYYIRYMDDMVLFHRNKKELHKVKKEVEQYLKKEHLLLKENWQLFKTESRPVDFVGYRFYRGYTTLRKRNSLRIKRRIKKIYKKYTLNKKDASEFISYWGCINKADSKNFYNKNIKKYIKIKKCREVIRNANRKQRETF